MARRFSPQLLGNVGAPRRRERPAYSSQSGLGKWGRARGISKDANVFQLYSWIRGAQLTRHRLRANMIRVQRSTNREVRYAGNAAQREWEVGFGFRG
jgi:hypothetical protein